MSQQIIQGPSSNGGVVNPVSFDPTIVGGLVGWFRADADVTLVSTKVSAWANQVSAVTVTQGTDANRPVVDTVSGRDWIRFTASQWLTGTEAALLTPPQVSGTPGVTDVYIAFTSQVVTIDGSNNSVWSAALHANSTDFTHYASGSVASSENRIARCIWATTGIDGLLFPAGAGTICDTDAHVHEVTKEGTSQRVAVDGVILEDEVAGTVDAQAAFDIICFGALARLSTFSGAGDFRLRDFIMVDGVPTESEQTYIREGLKARAGI